MFISLYEKYIKKQQQPDFQDVLGLVYYVEKWIVSFENEYVASLGMRLKMWDSTYRWTDFFLKDIHT